MYAYIYVEYYYIIICHDRIHYYIARVGSQEINTDHNPISH